MRFILVFCTHHVPIFASAYNQLLGSVLALRFFDLVPFSPMGCCASAPTPSSPILPAAKVPALLQGATGGASYVPVDPPPDTDMITQAPLPPSNKGSRPAHNSAVRTVETTAQTQTQAYPVPDGLLPLPPRNHDTARVPEPPPRAVPVSPSIYNERTLVSSPSQSIAGLTAYPLAQSAIGTLSSRPPEHDRTRCAPSAYRSAPLKKSTSAQLLSQSGTPTSSSHPMARTMSASGLAPGAGSVDRLRRYPSITLGTNQAQVPDGDDNQQLTSTLHTVLSHQNRYAPGFYLLTNQ